MTVVQVKHLLGTRQLISVKAAEALVRDGTGKLYILPGAPGYVGHVRGGVMIIEKKAGFDLYMDTSNQLRGTRAASPSELAVALPVDEFMLFRPSVSCLRIKGGVLFTTIGRFNISSSEPWYINRQGLEFHERTGLVSGASKESLIQSKDAPGMVAVRRTMKLGRRVGRAYVTHEVKLGTGLNEWAGLDFTG